MKLVAYINWKRDIIRSMPTDEALKKLKKVFGNQIQVDKKAAITKFYGIYDINLANNVSFIVNFPAKNCDFLFTSGTKKSSDIIGKSYDKDLTLLREGWTYLEKKLKEEKVRFKLTGLKIILGTNAEFERIKTNFFSYLYSNLDQLVSSEAAINILVAILRYIPNSSITIDLLETALGSSIFFLTVWLIISGIKYWRLDEYEFKTR